MLSLSMRPAGTLYLHCNAHVNAKVQTLLQAQLVSYIERPRFQTFL